MDDLLGHRDDAAPVPPGPRAAALHMSVYADLYRRIQTGELQPGAQLPGERELSTTYHVSRVTVRQALARAQEDGLLTRSPARGTFVTRPQVVQDLATVRPFRTSIEAASMRPSYELLDHRQLPVALDVAESLGVRTGTPALRVRLIGLASGRPLASYTVWIVPPLAEYIQKNVALLTTRSTYELTAEFLGLAQLEVDQTFEVAEVDDQTARLLRISPGTCAFRTSSVYRTTEGRAVELREAIYPGDRYKFHAHRVISL